MKTAAAQQTTHRMDEQRFDQLYREYHQLIYRAAYNITGDRDEAEDVLQNVFVTLIEMGFQPESTENLKGYLHQTAVNEARNLVRSRRRRNDGYEDVEFLDDFASVDDANAGRRREALLDAMAKLKPHELQVLTLHYQEGYSHAEIARMWGKTYDAVARAFLRAEKRLKQLMCDRSEQNQ